jgi:dihydroflavonol-4-reductase
MIAVTGATGLIGSFLLRRLLQENVPFVALKRKGADLSGFEDIKNQVNWKEADILDEVALEEAFKNCDTVIHAAAIVSFNPRDKKQLYQTNTIGTKYVVNACLNLGIRKLVYLSSVAALGRNKKSVMVDESSQWTNSSLNTYYGESKYLAELEVWRGKEEGLDVAVINPSVVLAPGNWEKSSAKIFKYVWKEKPFYTSGSFNYIDVRDLVDIIMEANKGRLTGERIIASAGKISYHDFLKMAAIHFNKKAPSIKIGSKLIQLLAVFEQLRSHITGSDPLITPETARLAHAGIVFDNSKIKNVMSFDFRSLDDTLHWCSSKYADQFRMA